MSEPIDPPPPIPALQRHLQMETDLFCFGCGYNLHGQVVTLDDRLGFLVCRCPECGRFHPAAMGVSATRPWLARLGVLLVSFWVLVVLFVLGLGGFFIGVCTFSHLERFTDLLQVPNRGWTMRVPLSPAVMNDPNYIEYRESEWKYTVFLSSLLSLGLGMFTAIAMWHLPRNRFSLLKLYGALIGVCVFSLWYAYYDIDAVFGWSIQRVLFYTAWSIILMTVGQHIGRPVARFAVRTIIPWKLRQHVQFLWKCDGLEPPPMPKAQSN